MEEDHLVGWLEDVGYGCRDDGDAGYDEQECQWMRDCGEQLMNRIGLKEQEGQGQQYVAEPQSRV